jgi:anti-sigma B factor antagonist
MIGWTRPLSAGYCAGLISSRNCIISEARQQGGRGMTGEKRPEAGSVNRDVVSLRGRINIDNSGEMRRTLGNTLRSKPAEVTVDLSSVTYIDISGLATLVEAARIARGQGTRMILGGIQGQALNLLQVTRLDQLFEINGRGVTS